jgi:hypothetical protein
MACWKQGFMQLCAWPPKAQLQWNFSKPDPHKTGPPWISADFLSPCWIFLCKGSLIKPATPLNRPLFLVPVLSSFEKFHCILWWNNFFIIEAQSLCYMKLKSSLIKHKIDGKESNFENDSYFLTARIFWAAYTSFTSCQPWICSLLQQILLEDSHKSIVSKNDCSLKNQCSHYTNTTHVHINGGQPQCL